MSTPERAPAALPPAADASETKATRLPRELPVLPVRDTVVFPGTVVPLSVAREKSKRLIDAVLAGDKLLVTVAQRRPDVDDPGLDDIYRVGTACQVLKLLRMPDGTNSLLVHGLARVGIEEWTAGEPYWRAAVNPYEDEELPASLELEALVYTARQAALQIVDLSPNIPDDAKLILESI